MLSGTETRDGLKKKQEDLFAEIQNTLHENKTVDKAFYRELNLLGYYLDQYDAFDQYVSFTENLKDLVIRPVKEQMERPVALVFRNWDTMPYAARKFASYVQMKVEVEDQRVF